MRQLSIMNWNSWSVIVWEAKDWRNISSFDLMPPLTKKRGQWRECTPAHPPHDKTTIIIQSSVVLGEDEPSYFMWGFIWTEELEEIRRVDKESIGVFSNRVGVSLGAGELVLKVVLIALSFSEFAGMWRGRDKGRPGKQMSNREERDGKSDLVQSGRSAANPASEARGC